jgi:hypothetical protein
MGVGGSIRRTCGIASAELGITVARGGTSRNTRKRKPARRRRKRRAPRILVVIAVALLIAGFVVRRTLVPRMTHYLAYRPPDHPATAPEADVMPAQEQPPAPDEHLTESDRQELERALKHKAK